MSKHCHLTLTYGNLPLPSNQRGNLRVEMQPVTGNIYGHGELEEEHVIWVEVAQCHQQAHGAAAICQLIQHCSELGAC